MKITPLQIIGQKITEVRYRYNPENEYGLQAFCSFFRLTNGSVIRIPTYADEVWASSNSALPAAYSKAPIAGAKITAIIKHRKIVDLYFRYYNNESDEEQRSFTEPENEVFITEINVGPAGVTDVDLKILNGDDFRELKQALEPGFEIRSLRGRQM